MAAVKRGGAEVERIVRETYGSAVPDQAAEVARHLYTPEDLALVPEGAKGLALGLGNPVSRARLQPGELVLDLGSGGGIDTFLAAQRVGETGEAFGLDMTDEMLARAIQNAKASGLKNVYFLKGRIERIPLPRQSVDVAISNGVLNLSTAKRRVFREAFRVLKPGGRLVFADSVVDGTLPPEILENEAAFAG